MCFDSEKTYDVYGDSDIILEPGLITQSRKYAVSPWTRPTRQRMVLVRAILVDSVSTT